MRSPHRYSEALGFVGGFLVGDVGCRRGDDLVHTGEAAALELWHEQAERMLEAIESPKPIELTAYEPLVVPIPKTVSRRRWSNL